MRLGRGQRVIWELWQMPSGPLIADFEDFGEAVGCVKEIVAHQGFSVLAYLCLASRQDTSKRYFERELRALIRTGRA